MEVPHYSVPAQVRQAETRRWHCLILLLVEGGHRLSVVPGR